MSSSFFEEKMTSPLGSESKPFVSEQKKIIVWDFGGVVFRWDPPNFAKMYLGGKYEQQCLAILAGPYWVPFDRGDLSYEELLDVYAGKSGIGMTRIEIDEMLQAAFESLAPIEGTIAMIQELKKQGYEQFGLTNGSGKYLNYVLSEKYVEKYGFLLSKLIPRKDILLSADVHRVKPEKEIYTIAEEIFHTAGKKVVFIDDNQKNTDAAETAKKNWTGIHFENPQQCRSDLEKLGIRFVPQLNPVSSVSKVEETTVSATERIIARL